MVNPQKILKIHIFHQNLIKTLAIYKKFDTYSHILQNMSQSQVVKLKKLYTLIQQNCIFSTLTIGYSYFSLEFNQNVHYLQEIRYFSHTLQNTSQSQVVKLTEHNQQKVECSRTHLFYLSESILIIIDIYRDCPNFSKILYVFFLL